MSINWHNFCISMRFMHLKMLSCLFYAFVANFTLIFYQIWPFKISQISCDISYQIPKYRVISCGSKKKYRSWVITTRARKNLQNFRIFWGPPFWKDRMGAAPQDWQTPVGDEKNRESKDRMGRLPFYPGHRCQAESRIEGRLPFYLVKKAALEGLLPFYPGYRRNPEFVGSAFLPG